MPEARSAVLRDITAPYSVETVTVAPPGPGEVLVRVVAAGMCHTDEIARSGLLGEHFLPAVLGHEGSGVVEEVGQGVTTLAPGDPVVLTFDSCGSCGPCRSGTPTHCASFEARNLAGIRPDGTGAVTDADGNPLTSRWVGQSSFGAYAIATERNTIKVDADVPLRLLGPLGCGIQTGAGVVLNTVKLAPGQSIAVFGTGAVGLAAILAAKLSGASDIVAVDLHPGRRELALELGATRAVDGADPDVAAAVRGTGTGLDGTGLDGTGLDGTGLDVTFDTTGVPAVMSTAIDVLRRPGRCVLVGAGFEPLTVHPVSLAGKTLTYVYEGDAVPHVFIPRLIALWKRGRFPFDRLITEYPLDQINQAESDARSGTVVKPVLLME